MLPGRNSIQERPVYRAAVFYFSGLLLLSIAAFWPTYFFPPKYETDWHVHLHGVAMLAWSSC